MSKLDTTRTHRTLSAISSDLRDYFESTISRASDVQIGRKPEGWKAQTLLFPSEVKSAPRDLNISRYDEFGIKTQIDRVRREVLTSYSLFLLSKN